MDTLTPEERSLRMSLVKAKHTQPERSIEALLTKMRIGFRRHDSALPGNPDFVFPRRKKVLFVHGCFWHRHAACRNGQRMPKSRLAFWQEKLDKNKRRDAKNFRHLNRLGWGYMIVWECQLRDPKRLVNRLKEFLRGTN